MQIIPIKALPNQAVTVTLAGQNCQVNIYQKLYGLFLDLYVNNTLVIAGALALDRNLLVRSAYLGFVGDLTFVDKQGTSDPTYDGLNSRYFLAYIAQSELVPQ